MLRCRGRTAPRPPYALFPRIMILLRFRHNMVFRVFLSAVVLLLSMTGAARSEPKRVLLLHSFGRDFAPWNEYARTIREELERQSPVPVDIFETSLATARFPDEAEGPFVDYLSTLFVKRQLDLVIAIGAPAVSFFSASPRATVSFSPRRVHGPGTAPSST